MTVTAVYAQTRLVEVHTSADTDSVTVLGSASAKRSFSKKFLDYFNDADKEKRNKKFDFSITDGPHCSSGTKLGLGLVAARFYHIDRNDMILPPFNISLHGDAPTVDFYLLGAREMHLFPRDKYHLDHNLYFYPFPSLYWGKGYDNRASNANESDYDHFQAQMRVDFIFRLARNFHVSPMAVFDYIYGYSIEKPELWEGMNARTTNFSLGLPLLYDPYDLLTNAYKGYYLRIDQRFSSAFLENKYAFSSTELDTRHYHKVWKGGILARQFHTLLNYGNPPWGLMTVLGSLCSMRGYYGERCRNKCVMDAQIEFRQHVWKRNRVVMWVGAGTISPRFSEFDMKHVLPNYGFGYH